MKALLLYLRICGPSGAWLPQKMQSVTFAGGSAIPWKCAPPPIPVLELPVMVQLVIVKLAPCEQIPPPPNIPPGEEKSLLAVIIQLVMVGALQTAVIPPPRYFPILSLMMQFLIRAALSW